jgi:hypothetical protein
MTVKFPKLLQIESSFCLACKKGFKSTQRKFEEE